MIQARTKSCLDPGDLSTAKWTVQGVETDGHTPSFTTNSVNSTFVGDYFTFTQADIPLKAEREEDGRGQSRIGVKITLSTDQYSDNVTIKQTKGTNEVGEGVFNVIRQEYEDVEKTHGLYQGTEPPNIPGAGAFSTQNQDIPNTEDAAAQFSGASTFQSRDYNSHIHTQDVPDGVRAACEWATSSDRDNPLPTTSSGDCFGAISNYRNPAHNASIAASSGSSNHQYGYAIDLIGSRNPWTYRFLKEAAEREYPNNTRRQNIWALGLIMVENGDARLGPNLTNQDGTYVGFSGNKVHAEWETD